MQLWKEREEVFFSEGSQTYGAEQWAASNFEEWRRDYNRRNPGSEIRRDILGSMECQELDEVLSTLIVETRKENGEKYRPLTLYQLLSGLHRYASLLYLDVDLPQFSSSNFTFRRLLTKALGSLKNGQGNYTLLGCFIPYNITV